MTTEPTKRCTKCGVLKYISEFHYRARKEQKHTWCKLCRNTKTNKDKHQVRNEVLKHYGGKCACCGEERYEFLCVDHINGGGNKHRKELGYSGNNFFRYLIRHKFPEGFRILCHNCNMSLGHYGYCPHSSITQPKYNELKIEYPKPPEKLTKQTTIFNKEELCTYTR